MACFVMRLGITRKALDGYGNYISVHFQALFPGFRVGWVSARRVIHAHYNEAKPICIQPAVDT